MRSIPALLLLLLATLAGAATTTTVDDRNGASVNAIVQAAVNSTENVVVIQVTPGQRVTVEFTCNQDWYYRSIGVDGSTHDSTTQKPVSANVPLRRSFTQTTTFYHVRQSADGTMCIDSLKVEPNK